MDASLGTGDTPDGSQTSPTDEERERVLAVLAGREPRLTELVEQACRRGPDPAHAGLDDDGLVVELGRRASAVAAASCRYLELVAELTARGVWAAHGAATPTQWLSFEHGLAPSTAAEHVRVGLRLRDLPRIREELAAGRISYSKVRALTRIAVPEIEELLLRWSVCATGAEVERIVRGFRRSCTGRGEPADARRAVTRRRHEDGTTTLSVRLPDHEAHEVESHLERLVELEEAEQEASTPRADSSAEESGWGDHQRPRTARKADALVHAVAAASAQGGVDTSGLDRHTLVLSGDVSALADDDASTAVVTAPDGTVPAMSRRALRRLACGAGLVLVAQDGRRPLDVGRRRRAPTVAQRRALAARDGTCRFPGCDARRHLHAHHVVHWADGGPTDLSNLVLLCSFHHHTVHDAGWTVTRVGDAFRFTAPDGATGRRTPWPHHARSDTGPPRADDDPPRRLRAQHRIGTHDLDLDLAVGVLHQELEAFLAGATSPPEDQPQQLAA